MDGLKSGILRYTQQVPTLLWFRANGRNILGPTMLRAIGQQCCVRLHGYLLYDSHGSASTIHPIFQNLASFISETGYSLYKGSFSRLIEYRKAKVRHGVTFQYVNRRPRAISDKLCKHCCNEFAPVRLP